MAKFDMSQVITNFDGTGIPEVNEAATRAARRKDANAPDVLRDLTLGSLCCNALLINTPGNMALSGFDKIAAYKLAKQIYDSLHNGGNHVELNEDQLMQLKALIEPNFTIVVVGQALDMLELKPEQIVN